MAREPASPSAVMSNHDVDTGTFATSVGEAVNLPSPAPSAPESHLSMAMEVPIEGAVSAAAQGEVERTLQQYAEALGKAICGVEAADRALGVEQPDITASTVVKAAERLRHPVGVDRPTKFDLAASLAAPLLSSVAGVLGNYLHSVPQAIIFAVAFTLALLLICRQAWRSRGELRRG